MIIKVYHNNKDYKIDTKQSIDISIPYNFNGAQPNFYDVNPGELTPLKFEETLAYPVYFFHFHQKSNFSSAVSG